MNLAALQELLPGATPPSRICYRLVDARYATEIDEIAHTVLYAWRYNPKGEFGVLYLAASADCAYREKLRRVGGRARDLPPQVAGTFKVNLLKCLDLTDAGILRNLGVNQQQILSPYDFSVPQALARQSRSLGFEAIIAPAAVGEDCTNLVVFKDKLVPPASCLLVSGSVQA